MLRLSRRCLDENPFSLEVKTSDKCCCVCINVCHAVSWILMFFEQWWYYALVVCLIFFLFIRRAVYASWVKGIFWDTSSNWAWVPCLLHPYLLANCMPAMLADVVSFRHAFSLGWCWRHCWRCQLCGSHGWCWYSSSLHVGGVGKGDDCKQRQSKKRSC